MSPPEVKPDPPSGESAPGSPDESPPPPTQQLDKLDLIGSRLPNLAQAAIVIVACVAFASAARSVVLPVLVAWVVSMTLKPLVRGLQRLHVPTVLASLVVVIVVVTAFALGAINLGRPALEWVQSAPENVPRLKERFQHILRRAVELGAATSVTIVSTNALEPSVPTSPPVEIKATGVTTTVFTWTGSMLAGVGETVALVFLLLATGDVFVQKLVRAMPTLHDKKRALEISHEIQHQISRYLFSVGMVNLGFGAAVALALWGLGMPNALMWGGVAALLNFVPYFGPVVGMIMVALAGLFAFESLGKALAPMGAYLALHLVEANAVTPFVLGRYFTLNPVVIFVAVIFCIWLWGVTGALLAMPLLVSVRVVCDRIPALGTVGEFLSSGDSPPKNSP
jgi:predicted PurR-regulated permease PerM